MAFNQGLAPFSWTPSSQNVMGPSASVPGTPIKGGELRAGDWFQVLVSFRNTNPPGVGVAYLPNFFLFHVIYTPNSDDATPHADQATTYGGSASNRRRNYRIDVGIWVQAPFDGQLSIVAGGDSDSRIIVDVLLNRGFRPRDRQREILEQRAEVERQIEDMADIAVFGMPLREPNGVETRSLGSTGIYPPPIVGTPQLVHATWVNIPIGHAPIPFPDGAEFVEVVNDTGVAGSPTRLTIAVLGNALALNCASGILRSIGSFGQGGACTDGTPATWSTPVALQSLTIWSRIGG